VKGYFTIFPENFILPLLKILITANLKPIKNLQGLRPGWACFFVGAKLFAKKLQNIPPAG